MSTLSFSRCSGRLFRLLVAMCIVLAFLLPVFVVPAAAAENEGWVEVRVDVPEGFNQNIIVTFEAIGSDSPDYDGYYTRVMEINGYTSHYRLPVGQYKVTQAFLETGDYRYNTELVNGPSEFTITGNRDDAAILLEFNTVFNESLKDGVKLPDPTEPVTEPETMPDENSSDSYGGSNAVGGTGSGNTGTKPGATVPGAAVPGDTSNDNVNVTLPSEMNSSGESSGFLGGNTTIGIDISSEPNHPGYDINPNVPAEFETDPTDTTEEAEEALESSVNDAKAKAVRLIVGFIGTVIFVLIVFGLAYWYRNKILND